MTEVVERAAEPGIAPDLRICSADARFSVREVKVAMVADLGTLQRLPA